MNRWAYYAVSAIVGAGLFALIQLVWPDSSPETGAGFDPGRDASSDPAGLAAPEPDESVSVQIVEPTPGPKDPADPGAEIVRVIDRFGGGASVGASGVPEVSPSPRLVDAVPPESPKLVAVPHEHLIGADPAALNQEALKARASLKAGDRDRAAAIYRSIFKVAHEREDVFLGAVVRDLLGLAKSDDERLEYLQYMAKRDTDAGRVWQWAMQAGQSLAEKSDRESLQSGWELLTRAYLASTTKEARGKVLRVLEPFLRENLFSGTASALFARHSVRERETLAAIAKRHGTTIDAIKRLNGLKSEVIQPRQVLRVLPGKVEIFVDKSDFRLWALVDGKFLLERPVGLGRNSSTPVGEFVVVERQQNPIWFRPGKTPIPSNDPRNILGSRWLGFRDTDEHSGFGIHGTREAGTVGREVSAGCIRLRNEDVDLLFDFTPWNTVVRVVD